MARKGNKKLNAQPKEWKSFDVFPFGNNKGKTIGWLADNKPQVLEWWRSGRKVIFSKDVQARINQSKFLGK